jgi:hypothetical protein
MSRVGLGLRKAHGPFRSYRRNRVRLINKPQMGFSVNTVLAPL